jgi:hypothetical protein
MLGIEARTQWLPRLLDRLRQVGRARLLAGVALVLVALAAVVHARCYAGVVIDDAFVTYRHAKHLVRGEGFTCNVGERVEGTSSALFAFFMAVPILLGADPYRLAGYVGSLLFAGCAVLGYLVVRTVMGDRRSHLIGLGAAALTAASARLAFHSQTGMETLAYTTLLLAGFWLHLRTVEGGKPGTSWAFVMGAAACMRPEGICFFLLLFLLGVLRRCRAQGLWRQLLRELGAFLAVFGPLLAFRLIYFGRFLPTSVHAKRGATDWVWSTSVSAAVRGLLRGAPAQMFYSYVEHNLLATALLCGTLLLSATRYAGIVIASMIVGCAATLVWNGGDWMPYDRLLVPCIPLLAVGTALGLRGVIFHDEQRSRLGHVPSSVATLAIVGLLCWRGSRPLDTESVGAVELADARQLGEKLARLRRAGDVVASEMAGILPYYWDAPTLDLFGLCDPYVAEHGAVQVLGTGRIDHAYVASHRPTFYAFERFGMAAAFYQGRFFTPHRNDYFLLEFPFGYFKSAQRSLMLMVRKDRPGVDELAQAVGAKLTDAGARFGDYGRPPPQPR